MVETCAGAVAMLLLSLSTSYEVTASKGDNSYKNRAFPTYTLCGAHSNSSVGANGDNDDCMHMCVACAWDACGCSTRPEDITSSTTSGRAVGATKGSSAKIGHQAKLATIGRAR